MFLWLSIGLSSFGLVSGYVGAQPNNAQAYNYRFWNNKATATGPFGLPNSDLVLRLGSGLAATDYLGCADFSDAKFISYWEDSGTNLFSMNYATGNGGTNVRHPFSLS